MTYQTTESYITIDSTLTEEQFVRCNELTHHIPGRFKGGPGRDWPDRYVFQADTEGELLALQQYVSEQKLPHSITTTREWKP